MAPLGTCEEIVALLAPHNTAPDGSGPQGMGEELGMAVLYGPGFVVEMPLTAGEGGAGNGEISQIMVTVTDEDFAWSVLMRLCRQLQWKMLDPESGRTFG
jgi:hypothetical protein